MQESCSFSQVSWAAFREKRGEDGTECCACLDELKDQDQCRIRSKCNHIYHKKCIDEWLRKDASCPLCRGSAYAHTNFIILCPQVIFMAFEEEDKEGNQVREDPDAPAYQYPSAPLDELFDILTTVDPSYIISLIRKLVPMDLKNSHNGLDGCDAPSEELKNNYMEKSAASLSEDRVQGAVNCDSEAMDVVEDLINLLVKDEKMRSRAVNLKSLVCQLEKRRGKRVGASCGILLQIEIMQNSWYLSLQLEKLLPSGQ